jgi:hypothetical protein
MGMSLHLPRTHGQKRLCAIERLDLALLVETQHDRSFGRIEVKPDDITHLFDKQRVGREREPDRLGQGTQAPMRRIGWHGLPTVLTSADASCQAEKHSYASKF